jgi:hypothetical protein
MLRNEGSGRAGFSVLRDTILSEGIRIVEMVLPSRASCPCPKSPMRPHFIKCFSWPCSIKTETKSL